ncbi:MAG: isoleucine--tRNA ligase [Nanoarchaeota archaeon]
MSRNYNFKEVEPKILEHWKNNGVWQKVKKKNKGKQKFYFLDGPPYTSGKVHIGTAWNKSLKDAILRFKRMRGFDVWDRAGYDMHGMPTEMATMKEQGIEDKEEIENMGVSKFVKACESLAKRNMVEMNKDFTRLGVWMDFENAYQPITPEYIEGEWWLIKKAHENGRLYLGEKTMTWCPKCSTALAKHELEYKKVTDHSIYLKFKVAGSENEYLIVWTTTPWTIPFNLGVMASPEITYVKAKVNDEVWLLAKELADEVIKEKAGKDYKLIDEFSGDKIKGLKYHHPLYEELKHKYRGFEEKSEKVHSVVMSEEYVTTEAGTGLVHMAPGCGPEDYEVGHREGIPPFNGVDEKGYFNKEMGHFKGWSAKGDEKKFVEYFDEKEALIKSEKFRHDYGHCWRCKNAVIYRTTSQWFFKVEALKENMRELNKNINWVPDYAGSRNYDSWLENLRDNGITRQRYWGTPLPVWKCDNCSEYVVIGSVEELGKYAKHIPKDLHKPWIDKVKWSCSCGGKMVREPDILDVWIDAGSASWNCLDYPRRKDLFEKMFPADFILEGIDQIRGWFNLLFVASMVSMEKPSFNAVYMHGFVQDAHGRKMSKSLGNYILPGEVVEKYGADTLRYYMIGGTNPGQDINYNFDDMKIKYKNLGILWNLMNLVIDTYEANKFEITKADRAGFGLAEMYIISKMNSAIKNQTEAFDNYRINEAPQIAEELFLELSRTYIQQVRDKLNQGTQSEKAQVFNVIYEVFYNSLKIFAPVCPMITEEIYQKLREITGTQKESIHEEDWPVYKEKEINKKLEQDFNIASDIIQAVLYAREKAQLGQRWPLPKVSVVTHSKSDREAVEIMEEIIKGQTNLKEVEVTEKLEHIEETVKPDVAAIGKEFGAKKDRIIERLISTSTKTLMDELEKGGHEMTVDGESMIITKSHIKVERSVPENLIESEYKNGFVYLDKSLTPELETEGYLREIIRRVQNLRKNSGLKRNDNVSLKVSSDSEMIERISRHSDYLKEKVGAKEVEFSEELKHFKHKTGEKIKGREFAISIEKV